MECRKLDLEKERKRLWLSSHRSDVHDVTCNISQYTCSLLLPRIPSWAQFMARCFHIARLVILLCRFMSSVLVPSNKLATQTTWRLRRIVLPGPGASLWTSDRCIPIKNLLMVFTLSLLVNKTSKRSFELFQNRMQKWSKQWSSRACHQPYRAVRLERRACGNSDASFVCTHTRWKRAVGEDGAGRWSVGGCCTFALLWQKQDNKWAPLYRIPNAGATTTVFLQKHFGLWTRIEGETTS